jgi:RimJ/RimL family protein N-acetyltransferase
VRTRKPRDGATAEIRLTDGTPARLRDLVGTDRQALQDLYAELSVESRHNRFQAAAPGRLTEPMLDRLVDDVDQRDHVAVLLLAPAGSDETPVGVGRMIRYAEDPTTADIALAVADNWQGRGAGSALAHALVARRPVGVVRLVTVVSADNSASLATLAALGVVDRIVAGGGQYDVTVTLKA